MKTRVLTLDWPNPSGGRPNRHTGAATPDGLRAGQVLVAWPSGAGDLQTFRR